MEKSIKPVKLTRPSSTKVYWCPFEGAYVVSTPMSSKLTVIRPEDFPKDFSAAHIIKLLDKIFE